MSTLVFTKAVQGGQSAFQQLCDRLCWPTLERYGNLHAVVYPEEAAKGGWKPEQHYVPARYSVRQGEDGRLAVDSDYRQMVQVLRDIEKAMNGEVVTLPRPSKAFCQQFALTKYQTKLREQGIASDLVEENGEWCLDVEPPTTGQSLEVTLS